MLRLNVRQLALLPELERAHAIQHTVALTIISIVWRVILDVTHATWEGFPASPIVQHASVQCINWT